MKQQRILLHYHIFKNAGSTIDWILRKNFPNAFFPLEPEREFQVVTNQEIIDFLSQHPNTSALSSHNFRLPSPNHPVFKFVEIVFIRHPLDRLQSMYYFYRAMKGSDFRAMQAKIMCLPDFLLWFMESQPFNVINSQTVILSKGWAGDYFFPPSRVQWREATTRIREIKFLGVVERTDESLVTAEYFLKPFFQELDLSYIVQNAREARKGSLPERLEEMRSLCGEHVYRTLESLNKLDLESWSFANQELDRRLTFVPNFQEKLSKFGTRCEMQLASSPVH